EIQMSRPRQRACLHDGLKLDLNKLIRRGTVQPGWKAGHTSSSGPMTTAGGPIASGYITADMTGSERGWFRFQGDDRDEWTDLVACKRHFGGRQWYLRSVAIGRRARAIWQCRTPTKFEPAYRNAAGGSKSTA